jgi:NAD(P)-dependent dehydrogenase (short-subunit alcohol dehydrogenase family)
MAIYDFSHKVALVTGGAAGIGRATALAFGRAHARVLVSDIDETRGEAVAAEIRAGGSEAVFQRADATSDTEVAALIRRAVDAWGRIDCAHNNVGFSWGGNILDTSIEDWDRTLDISLKAPFLCMRHELPIMIAQGSGTIVNTASMAGVRYSAEANGAYSAAKAGVIHLTRYAAMTHAKDGIRINAVSPGLVRTEAVAKFMSEEQQRAYAGQAQAIGRPVEPEEIAEAVLWLCSDAAAMVTGENIHVAGGMQAG